MFINYIKEDILCKEIENIPRFMTILFEKLVC